MSREAMSFRCIASKQDSNTVLFVYQSDAHRQPWIFLTKRKAKFNDRRGLHFETTHTVSENDAFVAFRFLLLLLLLHSISYGRTTTGADRKAINFTEKIDTKQNKRNEWQQPNNNREKKNNEKERRTFNFVRFLEQKNVFKRPLFVFNWTSHQHRPLLIYWLNIGRPNARTAHSNSPSPFEMETIDNQRRR